MAITIDGVLYAKADPFNASYGVENPVYALVAIGANDHEIGNREDVVDFV